MEFLRENKRAIIFVITTCFVLWTVSVMLIPLLFG